MLLFPAEAATFDPCGPTVRWTYSDDLGEEDGEDRLHGSIDRGADEPHKDVRPLGDVQTQHFKERHVGNVFILQNQGTEPSLSLIRSRQTDLIHFYYCLICLPESRAMHPQGVNWIVIWNTGCVITIDVIT